MRSAAAVVRGAQRRLFATFSVASADRPPVSALYANLRPLGLPELSAAADASAQGKHSAAYASLCRAGDILLPMAGSSAQLRQAGAAIWVLQCAETAWSPRPRTGVPADLPLKEAAEAAAADPDNGELATCFAWAAAVLLPLSGHGAPSAPAPPPGCSPAITAALQALAAARGGGGAGQAAEGGSLVQRLASAEAAEAQGVPPESVDPELGAAALAAAALAPDAGPELRCLAALHGGRRACAAAVGEQGGIWCEHYSGGAASATERLLAPHELPPLCMGGESPGDKVEAAALSSDKDAVRDSCSAVFKPLTECLTLCQEQLAGLRQEDEEQVHWQRRRALCLKLLYVLYARKLDYVFATGLFNRLRTEYAAVRCGTSADQAQVIRLHLPLLHAVRQEKELASLTQQLAAVESA
eukprot:TRINITY_DN5719_c0_g1_i1.p1 TRINITY_DN5719_c0_g1~~TRINITY_DN5719_c0_g1_i1.p1  ORF type:complete len:413 (+),score=85.04 TRINITY_DN5719_c0_g1_i1:81-1319(+)